MKDIKKEALATISMILEGFMVIGEDAEVRPAEEINGLCTLTTDFEGPALIVRVRTNEAVGKVLVGGGGATLAALQKTFFAALGFRMGGPNSLHHPIWLEVNGRRPDLRRERGEETREPATPPEPKVVKISVDAPEGVKVEIATKTG